MREKEVYKPNCCTECTFVDECYSETRIKCADYEIAIKEYHKGLEEGSVKAKELEKENAELKLQLEDWKADHEHNLELMKGLNGKIAELKEQIEKMKCCANCKSFDVCAGAYLKNGFRGYIDELKQPCYKWE